jgi:hypothetical protein
MANYVTSAASAGSSLAVFDYFKSGRPAFGRCL